MFSGKLLGILWYFTVKNTAKVNIPNFEEDMIFISTVGIVWTLTPDNSITKWYCNLTVDILY